MYAYPSPPPPQAWAFPGPAPSPAATPAAAAAAAATAAAFFYPPSPYTPQPTPVASPSPGPGSSKRGHAHRASYSAATPAHLKEHYRRSSPLAAGFSSPYYDDFATTSRHARRQAQAQAAQVQAQAQAQAATAQAFSATAGVFTPPGPFKTPPPEATYPQAYPASPRPQPQSYPQSPRPREREMHSSDSHGHSHRRSRRASTSTPARPHRKPKPRATPRPRATEEDRIRAGIPSGYSLKNWDPAETPILLLGSAFDADSLGKWIYDWTIYYHTVHSPLADMAGELWLLLISLAGKVKQSYERLETLTVPAHREIVEDFLVSGDRLFARFDRLLKSCETYMLARAHREGHGKIVMGLDAGCEFVDSIFGRDRELANTEKLMQSIRLWVMRFEVNCDEILR